MKYGGFTFTNISISLRVHGYANVFVFCGDWWLVSAIFLCCLSFETGLSLNSEST